MRSSASSGKPEPREQAPRAGSWSGRLGRLCARIPVGPRWLALLIAAHLVFGLVRFPVGAVAKRAESIGSYRRLGAAGWYFRKADEETRRIVAWLLESVPPDAVVAFDGGLQGQLQLLAPLLFPRLLVHASSVEGGVDAAGRRVFSGAAPWLPSPDRPGAEPVPVVLGALGALRLEYR